jgi:hypothetical protein
VTGDLAKGQQGQLGHIGSRRYEQTATKRSHISKPPARSVPASPSSQARGWGVHPSRNATSALAGGTGPHTAAHKRRETWMAPVSSTTPAGPSLRNGRCPRSVVRREGRALATDHHQPFCRRVTVQVPPGHVARPVARAIPGRKGPCARFAVRAFMSRALSRSVVPATPHSSQCTISSMPRGRTRWAVAQTRAAASRPPAAPCRARAAPCGRHQRYTTGTYAVLLRTRSNEPGARPVRRRTRPGASRPGARHSSSDEE